jgi:lambda family phage minor tail protein L
VSDQVSRAAQLLDTDSLVELWELDTTALTNVFGVVGTGSIYRWTPGILNYRLEGKVGPASNPSTIVLDKQISFPNSALTYTLQLTDPVTFVVTDPLPIVGIAQSNGITLVALVTPLPAAPVEGTGWLLQSSGNVSFGGVAYTPIPIEVTQMEYSGQGQLPRPVLRISNIGGLAGALVVQFGDIVGAKIKRTQTFRSFLDGEATPDVSAVFEPDIFTVDRKSAHNNAYIEFELAADLDQQGISLPKRIVLRDACDQTYRQWSTIGDGGHFIYGTCPYNDPARWYKADGSAGLVAADDLCGKKVSDCLLRFGTTARLPFRGFPGVAIAQV